jgi:hypothetical protein
MRSYLRLLLLVLLLAGCNLTTEEEPIGPTATTPVDVGGKPSVVINSPATGTSFTVNREILVSATATDTVGVTRMQLFANGSIVKTVTSEVTTGNQNFNAVLDYTPTQTGDLVLRVIAYRNTVVSDPQEITIKVNTAAVPTSTSLPGGNNGGGGGPVLPTIDPNDPTCRARANTGLNMRQGPGVNFPVVRILTAGEVVPIIGRLGDNSWWKVQSFSVTGWVSAQFTIISGSNCTFVPVENGPTPSPQPTNIPSSTPAPTLTPTPIPQPADLVVVDLSGPTQITLPAGSAGVTRTYTFTVTNTGGTRTGQTTTTLRILPSGTPVYISTANLRPGESIALQADLTFTSTGPFQIEVAADAENVVTNEISEFNNKALETITINP